MGIGLLLLKCTSNKNNILSNNPEITFFKKVYQRHTNFTQETSPLYFNTSIDFDKQLTVNLSKNADLISNITLKIVLPDIPQTTHSLLPVGKKKFKWINKIGLGIIKYINLEIGGILIDKQYGDWLNIYYELFRGEDNDNIFIIGDNNIELTEYSTYKNYYSLYIPLKFFFNLEPNFFIPILSITSQDIKLNIQLNTFLECYKESPSHYFEVDSNICLYKEDEYLYQNMNQIKNVFLHEPTTGISGQ